MARLTPFEIGQIKAHLHHGLGVTAISGLVTKTDCLGNHQRLVLEPAASSAGPHFLHLSVVISFVLRVARVNNA